MTEKVGKMLQIVRKLWIYAKNYPFSVALLIIVWLLSFCTPPKTKLDGVAFIDKWTHIVMYGTTGLAIWIESIRLRRMPPAKKIFLWAWLALLVMSAVIEVLQETCTGGRRSGDLADFAANAVGVSLAAVIGLIVLRLRTSRD